MNFATKLAAVTFIAALALSLGAGLASADAGSLDSSNQTDGRYGGIT